MNKAQTLDSQDGYPSREDFNAAARRVMQRCDDLAQCSEDTNCLTRTFCGEAMRQAHDLLRQWMHQADLVTRIDALGNIIGRYPTNAAEVSVFMIGSHLDTVVDAGKFDGPLGVLLGVATAELLKSSDIALPFALDIVGFSEEEGVRFSTPFLGSRAMTGDFDELLFQLTDPQGCTLQQALIDFGVNPNQLSESQYSRAELIGFLEPHIEQGPVLEQETLPTGIVSAIAGQTRSTFQFCGRAGHAGTVPHSLRRDALAAAAEFIIAVEQLGQQTDGLFATVANVSVHPNLSNVIAQEARVRLDLRHPFDNRRLAAYDQIKSMATGCGARRNVAVAVTRSEHQPAVQMDTDLADHLQAASQAAGIPVRRLVSGAGHDALIMAGMTPCAMLFLRCRGGISHHPDESVDVADVRVALEVMMRFVRRIATTIQPTSRSDES